MPLMVSNFMQNIKKIKWANFQQYTKKLILSICSAHFCSFLPSFGETGIFPEKWWHHLKRLMVFYLYAKNYKKQLNGSKDIAIWEIKWYDWSRAFTSREREFSQIWNLHRKFANHNTLHFRSFLAKNNDSILHKIIKSPFLPIFGPFFPFFGKMIIFLKNGIWGSIYPLMPSNFMQNIKKIQWANFEQYTKKVDFVQLPRPLLLLFAHFGGK